MFLDFSQRNLMFLKLFRIFLILHLFRLCGRLCFELRKDIMKTNTLTLIEEYTPTVEDTKKAEIVIKYISNFSEKKKIKNLELALNFQGNIKNLQLPLSIMPFLMDILNEVAHGNSVTIVPFNKEFTTQEAADILNVSRPFIIKILESGQIPFHKVGAHRRIKAKDLMSFKKKMNKKSKDALEKLAKISQEDKLGYED